MLLFGQLEVPAWLLLCVMGVLLIYVMGKRNQDALKKLGLPGPSWLMPLFGAFPSIIKKGQYQFDLDMLKTYGKTVGYMEGTEAAILSKDLAFLKQVMIKEWYNFPNHKTGGEIPEYGFRKMLPFLEDEHWKMIRSQMSPAFSSGKLKKMVGLIHVASENLKEDLAAIAARDEVFDPKEAFGHYTMDVLTSTSFGIQVNTSKDKDNEFVQHGKKFFDPSFLNPLAIAFIMAPFMIKPLLKLGFTIVPKESSAFLREVVNQAVNAKERDSNGREDFLQLMVNARRSSGEFEDMVLNAAKENEDENLLPSVKKGEMSDEEILGGAMIFFSAGYDTTASTLQFLAYELALNSDIQDKLIQEIDDVLGKNHPSYEVVGKLQYLDMCIHETLRLYPIGYRTDRVCKNSTTIEGISVPKGINIKISVAGVHMDPDIYPNPEVFDPERFTAEAKAARDPFAFQPFGAGPRACIGMRMALLKIKIGMAMALQRVRFMQCDDTKVPITFGNFHTLGPDKPIQLKMQLRD